MVRAQVEVRGTRWESLWLDNLGLLRLDTLEKTLLLERLVLQLENVVSR